MVWMVTYETLCMDVTCANCGMDVNPLVGFGDTVVWM